MCQKYISHLIANKYFSIFLSTNVHTSYLDSRGNSYFKILILYFYNEIVETILVYFKTQLWVYILHIYTSTVSVLEIFQYLLFHSLPALNYSDVVKYNPLAPHIYPVLKSSNSLLDNLGFMYSGDIFCIMMIDYFRMIYNA